MSVEDRFRRYENVNTGVCVVEYEPFSTIVYCNPIFASFLTAHPESIEGRSLDELTISDRLHYDEIKPLLMKVTKAIGFFGGFCVRVYDQAPTGEKLIKLLKIYRAEPVRYEDRQFLVGFVRKPTKFERWLNASRLDTDVDFLWKPVLNFLLSGKWRPWVTATSVVWGPILAREFPILLELLQQVL